ncbi:MAG: DUF3857 domain-containing protein [Gemmatimonadota bacterium]
MPDRTPLRHLAAGLGVSLALAALPGAGNAQAPDTLTFSIDSLLALTADSADYPEEPVLALLVDGAVRLQAVGTGVRTFRYAWQLLRQEALRALAERTISYDAGREEFTLRWARVLDRDGNVVSAEPIHPHPGLQLHYPGDRSRHGRQLLAAPRRERRRHGAALPAPGGPAGSPRSPPATAERGGAGDPPRGRSLDT